MAYIQPGVYEMKNGESVKIRTAHTSDATEMRKLTREVIKEDVGLILTEDEYTFTVREQAQRVHNSLYSPHHLLITALHGGTLCGIASFEPEQPIKKMRHHGHIGLIVAKPYRSLGVGRYLMETIVDWAKTQETIHKVSLEVLSNNEPAITLYLNMGFEPVGCFHNHILQSDGTYADVYRMELITSTPAFQPGDK
ncbi:GNAT family N-acetyltransferase [Bacillus sp. H-16]|uniref:GNAT family N-acetyltransferase n=1 Tax=Alteribacter salitolerans TaxID=2912333 RepID=UPI0019647E28|nr:GNAT family N-acetyltransferase [Alteribacter salitolerans]MBM7097690.1 GNAT family N-acetyltransferase [Alteribacter salitolerans]